MQGAQRVDGVGAPAAHPLHVGDGEMGVVRHRQTDISVSNSFGFGGQNSALVIRRWAE